MAWWCAAGGADEVADGVGVAQEPWFDAHFADDLDHASFLAGGGPQVEGLPVGDVAGRRRDVFDEVVAPSPLDEDWDEVGPGRGSAQVNAQQVVLGGASGAAFGDAEA